MGFFAHVIDKEPLDLPIPDDYSLFLLQACVDPEDDVNPEDAGKPICLYVQTPNEEDEVAVCVLNPSTGLYHCQLSLEFGSEDGPLTIRTNRGRLNLSGKWTWGEECEEDCCQPCGDDEEEEEEEEGDEEDEEEEAPELVPVVEEVPVKKEAPAAKKQKLNEIKTEGKTTEPVAKAVKSVVQEADKEEEGKRKQKGLKPWKVHPFGDEGIPVPEPKVIQKAGGLQVTDHIVGKGELPKNGASVSILYEGFLPNGTLFDSKQRVKAPFTFRLGTGQVIKGMDLGITGMRIGGARELFIPSDIG